GPAEGTPGALGHRAQAEPARDAALAGAQADRRHRRQGGPPRDPRHARHRAAPRGRRGGRL
ncbi:MAG: LSU ribosomal protein L30p (L7e), partial [uncultured Nocardioidaceae bacterium]